MQAAINIEFDQLVQLAKQLPTTKWIQLKKEVEESSTPPTKNEALIDLLLSAPTYTNEQLEEIETTRNAINQR